MIAKHALTPQDRIYELIKTISIFWIGTCICRLLMWIVNIYILQPNNIQTTDQEIDKHIVYLRSILGCYTTIYIIFLTPLIEEVCFRLSLSFKKKDILITLYTLIFACFINLTGGLKSITWIKVLILVIIFVALYFPYNSINQNKFTSIQIKYSKYIIYASIFLFAFVHIFNFSSLEWILVPYYMSYILYLLILSYSITRLRIYNGFWWGYGLHAINNAFAALATSGI